MWRLFLLFIVFLGASRYLYADNVTCEGALTPTSITLPAANVTLGNNISDYTVLYSIKNGITAFSSISCSKTITYVMSMTDIPAGNAIPDQSYGGKMHKIFPTSISGLGISVVNAEPSSTAADRLSVPAWPSTQFEYSMSGTGYANWFDMYLWKIPGDLPVSSGSLNFVGPTLNHLFTPKSTSDTISSATLPIMQGNSRFLMWSNVKISGSVNLISGTCNVNGGSKVVNMGRFDAGGKSNSAWVDASFNLDCPKAFGYGGIATNVRLSSNGTITPNSSKNNPIRIQIVPRTAVVDANSGILGLDGTGAQGYGIQLAWGDSGILGSGTPANPVILNGWTLANTLNSAYSASAYAIGASAISTSADGTIKMAARYVRTTGASQPGPANAGVEVIASYQ